MPQDSPALYCSRTWLINDSNTVIGISPLFSKPPAFANALVQNIGGGNTMVFNHAARCLLWEAGNPVDLITHDWWTYMLVSGSGGTVYYDPYPAVSYRQHNANLVGANTSWRARLGRVRMLLQGRFRNWNDVHTQALHAMRDRLRPENRALLDHFTLTRNSALIPRLRGLWHCGIYRQTLLGNLGLMLGAILKKI